MEYLVKFTMWAVNLPFGVPHLIALSCMGVLVSILLFNQIGE